MNVTHTEAGAHMDTQALAALTGRTPWSVRTVCERGPDGYDAKACIASLHAQPVEPTLLTAADAQRYLGLPAGTVRQWAFRGQLPSHDRDGLGRPLYSAADILELWGRG